MGQRKRIQRLSVIAAKVLALALAGSVIAMTRSSDERVLSAVGAATGVLALIFESWSRFFPSTNGTVRMPESHADELAATVLREWEGEARARKLDDPRLLPVTWTAPAER